jgi:hypothetical protein
LFKFGGIKLGNTFVVIGQPNNVVFCDKKQKIPLPILFTQSDQPANKFGMAFVM